MHEERKSPTSRKAKWLRVLENDTQVLRHLSGPPRFVAMQSAVIQSVRPTENRDCNKEESACEPHMTVPS